MRRADKTWIQQLWLLSLWSYFHTHEPQATTFADSDSSDSVVGRTLTNVKERDTAGKFRVCVILGDSPVYPHTL
jgi:hypothetical protein